MAQSKRVLWEVAVFPVLETTGSEAVAVHDHSLQLGQVGDAHGFHSVEAVALHAQQSQVGEVLQLNRVDAIVAGVVFNSDDFHSGWDALIVLNTTDPCGTHNPVRDHLVLVQSEQFVQQRQSLLLPDALNQVLHEGMLFFTLPQNTHLHQLTDRPSLVRVLYQALAHKVHRFWRELRLRQSTQPKTLYAASQLIAFEGCKGVAFQRQFQHNHSQ